MHEALNFDPDDLAAAMRDAYSDLIAFVNTPEFIDLYEELRALPPQKRPAFVAEVFLRPEELRKRGVVVPDGVLIEASAFGDRRPTLFAVKKYLPPKFHVVWENVNLTIDNPYEEAAVTRESSMTWRRPLPVALQNALMSANVDLESLPDTFGVDSTRLSTSSPRVDAQPGSES